jgi:hypothetical protein
VRCIESMGWRAGLAGVVWLTGCASPMPGSRPEPGGDTARPPAVVLLPSPGSARSWDELRLDAARRMVAANPGLVYAGLPPDPLLAVPVLEIELNGDGSIRRIEVLRHPKQAHDTVQIAIDAVRRAAPFGDVSRLPKPWKFAETFLFNDDRKFKPRTLDL